MQVLADFYRRNDLSHRQSAKPTGRPCHRGAARWVNRPGCDAKKVVPAGKEVYVAVRPEKCTCGRTMGMKITLLAVWQCSLYWHGYPNRCATARRPECAGASNSAPGSRPLASEGDEVTVSFSAQARARVLTE